MSNHDFTQFDYSLNKKKVTLYAVVNFGATGAPTLEQWSPPTAGAAGSYSAAIVTPVPYSAYSPPGTQGIRGIVRNSTGNYTITFQQNHVRLLGINPTWADSATIAAANVTAFGVPEPLVKVIGNTTNVTTIPNGTLSFSVWAPTPGSPAVFPYVATDPLTGSQLLLEIVVDDSPVI